MTMLPKTIGKSGMLSLFYVIALMHAEVRAMGITNLDKSLASGTVAAEELVFLISFEKAYNAEKAKGSRAQAASDGIFNSVAKDVRFKKEGNLPTVSETRRTFNRLNLAAQAGIEKIEGTEKLLNSDECKKALQAACIDIDALKQEMSNAMEGCKRYVTVTASILDLLQDVENKKQ